MAFDPEPTVNRIPTMLEHVIVTLQDSLIDGDNVQSAKFAVHVLDQDGSEIRTITGNLVPHLTQAQINGLQSFMVQLRAQATAEIL